jgi:glycerol uptake facilitator-like aquaporin
MMGGNITGSAMNPARAFGPAVASGLIGSQMIYWIGPIIGAIVASLVGETLFKEEKN